MRKLIIPVMLVLLLLTAFGEAFAQTTTVVTRSGQRFRAQLIDMSGGDALTIREPNGRQRQIPFYAVALIDFVGDGRNISQRELNRASQSPDGLIVLRNGRTVPGNVGDMYSNQLVVAGNFGARNIPLNQIARIYFGNGSGSEDGPYTDEPSRSYDPYADRDRPGIYDGGYASRTFTIQSNQTWTNTGINVNRGQRIHFRANGNVRLSQNDADSGTPAGANNGRLAGNSPLPQVTGGMLIGRVGNGRPFVIGAETEITMPASGRLYLGINDDHVQDNSGSFDVQITAQ